MATKDRYSSRIHKLREKMARQEIDHFLVLSPANRYYLSGYELFDPQCNESAGCLLVSAEKTLLLTDPRYLEAGKECFSAQDIFIYSRNKFEKINEFLKKNGVSSLGFEPQWMNYEFFDSLQNEFEMVSAPGLVEGLRMVKDKDEISALRRSCRLTHQVFNSIENMLEPGLFETDIAWTIEKMFRESQASGLSFSTIVASGPRAALPHAIPGKSPVKADSPLLIDTGCRLDDYCSDQTRTFWVGKNQTDAFKITKELVIEAQELAISRIEPEMPVSQAYEMVRSFFADKGVVEHFTHALGHGIGLETHEPPGLGPSGKGVFMPGMVFTVEPGLYYPEWGGVRWEYMVLITENGIEIL